MIYAQSNSQSAVSLTIELDGRNTIECASALFGIYVNAEMSNDSYGTDASLTITVMGVWKFLVLPTEFMSKAEQAMLP